ncbi:MAG: hypothetical protein AAGD25_09290 [Cyanobacteria bacterium P01_F01_bin.150]
MLNRVMLSSISSVTTLACVLAWPLTATAVLRPVSGSHQASTSIQLSSGFLNPDPFVEQPADDLSGLMITGCSQVGSGGPQVCLQWLGDALSTCLEWGDEAVVTACMQKGTTSSEGDEGGYESDSAGRSSSQTDWGFSVEFTLQ